MQKKQSRVLVFLLLWIVAMIAVPLVRAKAEGKLEVVEIDYDEETITVKSNSTDQFLYYSDSKQKNWESAYGTFKENVTYGEGENQTCRGYVLDISWVKKTKDYELTLKGDVSTDVLSVRLPMQNKSIKVKYDYLAQDFTVENSNNYPLQWRKADSTIWHDVSEEGKTGASEATKSAMNKLFAKGAYIYVRTKPTNGTSANPGVRPSKEIKVSLKKQASAPSVSMKTAGILTVNTTHEYQVAGTDTWTKCDAKTLDLRKIATKAFYQGATTPEEVTIYVRVAATSSKLPSASTVITVRAQEAAPVNEGGETAQQQIKYGFKNATALEVTFNEIKEKGDDGKEVVVKEKPSSKNPYEYTVVKPAEGVTINNAQPAEDATWTAITSGTVTISAEKAPEGSFLFIRKRGRLESKVVYQPESQACKHQVTGYPKGSEVELVTNNNGNVAFWENAIVAGKEVTYLRLVKEQGGKVDGLQFIVKVTEYGDVKIASITCGGKEILYLDTVTPSAITEGTDTTTGSAITVTITDTSEYEKILKEFNQDQPLKIILTNGEVISDKVTLKVLQGASVEKAQTFDVIHRTEEAQKSFEFVVKAGMINQGKDNTSTPKYTKIQGIRFTDKKLILNENDYTVKVTATDNTAIPEDGAESYTVIIKESAFDKAFLDRDIKLDTAYPLVIEMSNKQEVAGISVKLCENAKVKEETLISMDVGTDYKAIELIFTFTDRNESLTRVTWNNIPVTKIAETVDGITKITISNLKELTLGENETSLQKPIIFEFSDGSIVSRAVFLTLTKH